MFDCAFLCIHTHLLVDTFDYIYMKRATSHRHSGPIIIFKIFLTTLIKNNYTNTYDHVRINCLSYILRLRAFYLTFYRKTVSIISAINIL